MAERQVSSNNIIDFYGYLIVFLFSFIFLAILSLLPPVAFDSYWQLQMGKDLLDNGLSPYVDHYSFTHHGEKISGAPVIFQLFFASLVSFFGDTLGRYAFKLLYISLILVFIFKYFKQVKASWFVVFLILPFLSYFIFLRLMVRPETISNVLIVMCLIFYLRARSSFTIKRLVPIGLLLLFWVNYHTPVFGYIIIFGLFVDKAMQKLVHHDDTFSWKQWFLWGGIIFFIGFINPQGQHFFISTITFLSSDFGQLIAEYTPAIQMYDQNKMVHILWILSIYFSLWSIFKRQYGFAVILIILTYYSWSLARLVPSAAIVNFLIIAFFLSQMSYAQLSSHFQPWLSKLILLLAIALSSVAYYSIFDVLSVDRKMRNNNSQNIQSRFPGQIADYLKKFHSGGNILNQIGIGGYLIYKLSPEYKVYIDGRTNILYPIEFTKHSISLRDPNKLKSEIENEDIQFAVYKNTAYSLWSFRDIDKLTINFADENFLLFSKPMKISFPLVSKLMVFPMCWKESNSSTLQHEIALAESTFKAQPFTLTSILAYYKQYLSSADKTRFIEKVEPENMQSDQLKRIVAYQALKNKQYNVSLRLFKALREQNDYDRLMLAYSMAMNEDFANAELMLDYLFFLNNKEKGSLLSDDKVAIMLHIFDIIKKGVPVNEMSPQLINQLNKGLKQINYNRGVFLNSPIPYQNECKILF